MYNTELKRMMAADWEKQRECLALEYEAMVIDGETMPEQAEMMRAAAALLRSVQPGDIEGL